MNDQEMSVLSNGSSWLKILETDKMSDIGGMKRNTVLVCCEKTTQND